MANRKMGQDGNTMLGRSGRKPGRGRKPGSNYTANAHSPHYWNYSESWSNPTGSGGANGERRADELILKDVTGRLAQHGQVDARDIAVEVKEGHVWLKGSVADRRTRKIATLAVEAIPGVIDVHNELHLQNAVKSVESS